MPRNVRRFTVLALASTVYMSAAVIYNESTSGDLSNSGSAPTQVSAAIGSNQIFGTTGRAAGVVDLDYFTFVVPTGSVLSAFVELAGTTAGGGGLSFIGLQAGDSVTVPTNAMSAAGLLGWTHYATTAQDIDLLPQMSSPSQGSDGFTTPLPSGTYSVWVQELSTGSFAYGFDLQITQVPEPGTASTFVFGIATAFAALKLRRHRRSG